MYRSITALLLQLLIPAAALEGEAAPGSSWIDDPTSQDEAFQRTPIVTPLFTVDLDLPPEDRWTATYSHPLFKNFAVDIDGYFKANIPAWSVPLIEKLAQNLEGHFPKYGLEMRAVARSLGASAGAIVLTNLVETLEGLAVDCAKSNNTGPCPKKKRQRGPGMCTSIVAQSPSGAMWHGRNLDWNLPTLLRKYVMDVEFVRSGKQVFRGTGVAGAVGLLHGLRPGAFSVSMDARDQGGSTFLDMLRFITGRHRTPSQLLREALETQGDFDAGLHVLGSNVLIQPIYYIVAGTQPGQAAVLSCARGHNAVDIWRLNATDAPAPWFLLQTNYDHWTKPPSWDDRTTPGIKHMLAMGQDKLGETGLREVMHQWPTFNHHTDVTAVIGTTAGAYTSFVWMGDSDGDHAGEAQAPVQPATAVPIVVV